MPFVLSFGKRDKHGGKNSLKKCIEAHMGGECLLAHTVSHVIKPVERVNLQLALDRLMDSDGAGRTLTGYSAVDHDHDTSLAHALARDNLVVAPVEREQLSRGLGKELDCVSRGLYLLRHQSEPIAIMIRVRDYGFRQHSLEVMAHKREIAHAALSQLLADANRQSVYKGKTISLEMEQHWQHEIVVRFHEMPEAARESIILPAAVMDVVERNVLGLLKHRETLNRSGRSTRHGVLFHGRPGTGKTLVARYLAHACSDHTVILLTGRQLGLIRESCQIAKLLAPSIVILEDVDLVAEERSHNKCRSFLHDLMDEMDGVGTKADIIFLLTTNRPEVIEPALSARPGRIDQAIEFPLPDAERRQKLFTLYGRGLDLQEVSLGGCVEQTEGVSPAFIEEVLRKAALMAAERGETTVPLRLRDSDVEQAVKELVMFGGALTRKLLGYGGADQSLK